MESKAQILAGKAYTKPEDEHLELRPYCKICHEYVPEGRFLAHAEHHIRQTNKLLKLLGEKELHNR